MKVLIWVFRILLIFLLVVFGLELLITGVLTLSSLFGVPPTSTEVFSGYFCLFASLVSFGFITLVILVKRTKVFLACVATYIIFIYAAFFSSTLSFYTSFPNDEGVVVTQVIDIQSFWQIFTNTLWSGPFVWFWILLLLFIATVTGYVLLLHREI